MKRPWTLWLLVVGNALLGTACGWLVSDFMLMWFSPEVWKGPHMPWQESLLPLAAIGGFVAVLYIASAVLLLMRWRWSWRASLLSNGATLGYVLVGIIVDRGGDWSDQVIALVLAAMVALHFAVGVKAASCPERIQT